MINGAFTPEQRAILNELVKCRRIQAGKLKALARAWDRSIASIQNAAIYARQGGYQTTNSRRGRGRSDHELKIGPYTLLMRRIWAEWERTHVSRAPTPQA